jgi:hypothetical protein
VATYAALAHTTWAGGYDFTGDLNYTTLQLRRDALERTVFGSTARNRLAGLQDVQSSVRGYWDSASNAVDPTVFPRLGGTLQAVTQTVSGTEGDVAYLYQAKYFSYEMFGQVGEVVPFSLALQGARGNGTLSVGAVRGRLLVDKGTISGTGTTGSAIQVGAVGASQYLYCAIQCFAIGTSFTLQIQSDNASNFPSATTQMTSDSITAVGGYWVTRVAGPITDDWWRVNVSAASGTSTIAVAIGIK